MNYELSLVSGDVEGDFRRAVEAGAEPAALRCGRAPRSTGQSIDTLSNIVVV